VQYFFDTYAIIEILNGNTRYEQFRVVRFTTTIMNLLEMHYAYLREGEPELAQQYLQRLQDSCSTITIDDCAAASDFKLAHKKNAVSYVDALGYVIALRVGARFLTGDQAFKGLPNVEYVR
jgi:uncharacterized protein